MLCDSYTHECVKFLPLISQKLCVFYSHKMGVCSSHTLFNVLFPHSSPEESCIERSGLVSEGVVVAYGGAVRAYGPPGPQY